jgi:hypothetical protein
VCSHYLPVVPAGGGVGCGEDSRPALSQPGFQPAKEKRVDLAMADTGDTVIHVYQIPSLVQAGKVA